MKEQATPSKYFVELDAILDTRMGTILRINPQAVMSVLEAGYLGRDRDLFKGIDPEQFKELYKNRDRLTLKASMMTPVLGLVRDFCLDTFEGNVKTPFLKEPSVIVNIYPYKLTVAEKEILRDALSHRIGETIAINFVDLSPSEITPGYLKQDICVISVYDPFEWLEAQSVNGNLKRMGCPDVMMLGALLFRNLEIKNADVKDFQKQMEFHAKPYIDFNLIAPHVFSASIGSVLPTKEKKNGASSS